MSRKPRRLCILSGFCVSVLLGYAALGAELVVNGKFETGDNLGWKSWQAPWGAAVTYNFAETEEPFEGVNSLHFSSSSGSFGVYQELCVEPGVEIRLSWAWKGESPGNGWWEVLVVDAPYSYDAVDNPSAHPETYMAAKWEKGFGGPYPEPEPDWTTGSDVFTPTSEVITLVLKCGSTEGGRVQVWFDAVEAVCDTTLLEVSSVTPALGKTAGGEAISVKGRVFPEGATVSLGDKELSGLVRLSTCELKGNTPPGEPGFVDVVVKTAQGSATLPGAFRYVAPPVVLSIEPSSGPVEGGTDVTIKGENFVGRAAQARDVTVRIGGKSLSSLVVVDESTITGRTPAGTEGPADVTVKTPFGETTLPGGFRYGTAGPRFVRGDCNADGSINISDGIFVLSFLFLGGDEPPCLEACNPDDGADLNISDGIAILNFLFLGGQAPAPPHPDCGTDETEGPSCLASHPNCL